MSWILFSYCNTSYISLGMSVSVTLTTVVPLRALVTLNLQSSANSRREAVGLALAYVHKPATGDLLVIRVMFSNW